jgi:mannose-1-phosphate guanylyltransferase/phosphomannomutase
MPNVLSKLGADVLVVNPLVSTIGMLGFDRMESATRLSELVRSSGAQLGAVIASDGEQLTLVDDTGLVLSDGDALLAVSRLVAETTPGARVAVPVSATWRLNEVLADLGAEVVWTQIGVANLMEVAQENGATLAASTEGGFAFPQFLPAYDAVATLVRVLAMLAKSDQRLSQLRAGLPHVCVAHETVLTPLDQKGAVMRVFLEGARAGEIVLIDGVKVISASGWTLVVPDTEEPLTHVFAEADDEASSLARARAAADEIRQFLAEN